MEISAKDIAGYLELLKTGLGYSVTLHGSFSGIHDLVRFNFHLNPYCIYVKNVLGCASVCEGKQRSVLKSCAKSPFFGVCYAGVGEFVYPITANGSTCGFICVSGYRGLDETMALEKTMHFIKKYGAPKKATLLSRQQNLSSNIPRRCDVDAAVKPLQIMLESYIENVDAQFGHDDNLYRRLLLYIIENRHRTVLMSDVAKEFHCSVSTLSHLFKKESGQSICEYITALRLKEAHWLLRQSTLSVTEISDSLGFCNSAYFSKVFKNAFKLSPTQLRKQHN